VAEHRHLRLVEIGQQAHAALMKRGALSGEGDASRRPLQQSHAEPVLESDDALADGRSRQPDALGCGRKTFGFGDMDEHADVFHPVDRHGAPLSRPATVARAFLFIYRPFD
jgi:hypothetical protein